MTGSSLAPIVIPIVIMPVLAFWLFMVYHAANHPGIKHPESPGPAAQRPAVGSARADSSVVPQQGGPVADAADPAAQPREELSAGGARR